MFVLHFFIFITEKKAMPMPSIGKASGNLFKRTQLPDSSFAIQFALLYNSFYANYINLLFI